MPLRVLLPLLSQFPAVEISVDNARTHQAVIHSKPSLSDDDLLARRRRDAPTHHHQVARRRRSSSWSPTPRDEAAREEGASRQGRGGKTGAPWGRGCAEEPLRGRPSQQPKTREAGHRPRNHEAPAPPSPTVDGRWDAGSAPSLGRGGVGGGSAAAPADTSPRIPARVPVLVAVPQLVDACPRLPVRNYS